MDAMSHLKEFNMPPQNIEPQFFVSNLLASMVRNLNCIFLKKIIILVLPLLLLACGSGGGGSQSDRSSSQQGNRAPELQEVQDFEIGEGVSLSLMLLATDADGGSLTISADSLPLFIDFADNGDGTATLLFDIPANSSGEYTVSLTVSDGFLSSVREFTVTVPETEPFFISLSGSAVKGPLANADVSVYVANSNPLLNFKGALIATGKTDDQARFIGLKIPKPVLSAYVIEVRSNEDTVDLSTGKFPVIPHLAAIVSDAVLSREQDVFVTLLTTITLDYLRVGNKSLDLIGIESTLAEVTEIVASYFNFDLVNIDPITRSPVVVDGSSEAALAKTVRYRAAIETIAAIGTMLATEFEPISAEIVLTIIANDIWELEHGQLLESDYADIFNSLTVASLAIPGTDKDGDPATSDPYSIDDIEALLYSEAAAFQLEAPESLIDGRIVFVPASIGPDSDNDGVPDRTDNCLDTDNLNQLDDDGDGIGNSCDSFTPTPEQILNDSVAPLVDIHYPPIHSATEVDVVVVRGKTSDDIGVKSVMVNGLTANSTNMYSDWYREVELEPGVNTISVEAIDLAGNRSVLQSVTIEGNGIYYGTLYALDVDDSSGLIYAIEGGSNVISIDMSTGYRSLISGYGTPGNSFEFGSLWDLKIDAVNNLAYVTDAELDGLLSVDLKTGKREVVASNDEGQLNDFNYPRSLALDLDNGRAIVLDNADVTRNFLIEVDLETGGKSILTEALSDPEMITYDKTKDRLLVSDDGSDAVVDVDLASGITKPIPDVTLSGPSNRPSKIVLDEESNSLYMSTSVAIAKEGGGFYGDYYISVLDLSTGERQVLSQNVDDDDNPPLGSVSAIGASKAGRKVVIGQYSRPVLGVDMTTGERNVITQNFGSLANDNLVARNVRLDKNTNQLLAVGQSNGIYFIDMNTFDRTLIVDHNEHLSSSKDAVLSTDGKTLYVWQAEIFQFPELIAIDIETQTIRVVSPKATGVSLDNTDLAYADKIMLDEAHNRVLVIDDGDEDVVAIDLLTGERSVFIGNEAGVMTRFYDLNLGAIDIAANKLWLLDDDSRFISIDLDTRQYNLVYEGSNAYTSVIYGPKQAALDRKSNRIITVGGNLIDGRHVMELIAFDLATGRSEVLFVGTGYLARETTAIKSLVWDDKKSLAIVYSSNLHRMIAIDVNNGQSAILP